MLEEFLMALQTKEVAFIGIGVSHSEMIRMFLQKGIHVTVCDRREKNELKAEFYQELVSLGADFQLGRHYLEKLENFDIIFRSPGVYFNLPELSNARNHGVVVTSEMEMFFSLCPCKTIGITGSDGKTTTSSIIAQMLREEGYTVHLGGNIGKALFPLLPKIRPTDVAVIELSSFQLLSMRQSPSICVITNITPNHLDVHKDMEEYIEAKSNIIKHQDAFGKAVINRDSPVAMQLAKYRRGYLETFSVKEEVMYGCGLYGCDLCVVKEGKKIPVLKKEEIFLPGAHNVENVLAAMTAVHDMVSLSVIRRVAETFSGVEHRIELVIRKNQVSWYNDSIATTPTRTRAGLLSFKQRVILIAGGYDKKLSYQKLGGLIVERAKAVILLGQTSGKIYDAIREQARNGKLVPPVICVHSLQEAVQNAEKMAVKGDIVLFSPASASFDLYRNFEERGKDYKRLVREICVK